MYNFRILWRAFFKFGSSVENYSNRSILYTAFGVRIHGIWISPSSFNLMTGLTGTDQAFIFFPPGDRSCIHVSHE